MHIVLDARHIRDFGIGTYIRGLLKGLAQLDEEDRYTIVVQPQDRDQFPVLPANFDFATYRHRDVERIDHFALPAFLRSLRPDLVHIPLNRVPWFMPRPYVVTVHDMSRQLLSGKGWRNQASLYRARRGLMRAARVIAVSASTRRNCETVLGVPASQVQVIHGAPDPRFAERPTDPAAAAAERRHQLDRYQVTYPFVLYAGNIKPQKNVPRLIEAFSVVRSELAGDLRYHDLRLVIIGDDLTRHPEVRRAAAQSRLGQAVRFLGYVPFETLRAFYESAAVFAFPSLNEGFGIPPLEAMTCGTPVVTSNVSSLPEVVGDAAVLVNPDNVWDIARGLREALVDDEVRRSLTERGYQRVREFSWQKTAAQVLETYRGAARRTG